MIPNMFTSLEGALSHPPGAILQAIHDQFALGHGLPPVLNWELLGDTSHNRGALAFRDQQRTEGEAWKCLAVAVFDRLGLEGAGWKREQYRRKSMISRANLISQLGQNESDPYRSIESIEQWFFACTPTSPAQLRILSQHAEAGDIRAMDSIQDFKASLSVIRLLDGKVSFSHEAMVREFLDLDL